MQIDTLLDHTMELLNLKNDAALSRALQVAPPVISKLRHGTLTLGASLMIRIHEVTGMSIAEIKTRAGLVTLNVRRAAVSGGVAA